MKQFLIAAFVLGLAACAPVDPAPTPGTSAGSAQTDCTARGGTMQRVGRAQTLQCVITYADAGRVCQSGSECQSRSCVGPVDASGRSNVSGQCQSTNMAFGCYTRINNGRAEAAICVD
jgi:hypothetical protein